MIKTLINNKWELLLPLHRSELTFWPYWEAKRLQALHDQIVNDNHYNRSKKQTIIDIGAEEGDLTALNAIWLQEYYTEENWDIHIIEPSNQVWPSIRSIWKANEIKSPAGCLSGFFSSRTLPGWEKGCAVWPKDAYGSISTVSGFRNLAENGSLPEVTLDDYCTFTGAQPSILTMDVEGSELEVLKGAVSVLEKYHPVIYIAIHPEFMFNQYSYYERDLHNILIDYNYVGEHLDYSHEHHWVFR